MLRLKTNITSFPVAHNRIIRIHFDNTCRLGSFQSQHRNEATKKI